MAAAAGSILATYLPILANGFVTIIASVYLLFSLGMLFNFFFRKLKTIFLASRQGTNRERLVKMLAFGGVTGAGLRPLLNLTIRVNPNIMPTAFILCSSIFICFSLVSWRIHTRSCRTCLCGRTLTQFDLQTWFYKKYFRWAWWQNSDHFYTSDRCYFLRCQPCFGSIFPICSLEGT